MNIAILGYGTVGKGVDDILSSSDLGVSVTKILELPDRLSDSRMTSEYTDILNDTEIDVVVECMGGIEPAHTFIAQALCAKKHVVTSNKAVVAAHFEEFVKTAQENGVQFFIEASCGGGVPWISSIGQAKRVDKIEYFFGIMNGTTNYIIDNMLKHDADFDEVLAKAQELGYAERDPSADIDGFDVRNKTFIGACCAFDVACVSDFPVMGMRNVTKADLDFLKMQNLTMKLLGRGVADYERKRYAVSVEPVAVRLDSLEAQVPQNFNLLTLYGKSVGELKFYGQGAGALPTGNAIVQDVLDIAAGKSYNYKFDSELSYDASLMCSDYIVRSQFAVAGLAEVESLSENYWKVYGVSAEKMAQILAELKNFDASAIAFALA